MMMVVIIFTWPLCLPTTKVKGELLLCEDGNREVNSLISDGSGGTSRVPAAAETNPMTPPPLWLICIHLLGFSIVDKFNKIDIP